MYIPPTNDIHIEKHVLDAVLRPPKSTIQKLVFNPSARATQYYNVLKYLAQAPCAMYTLEVFQICLTQRKNMLSILLAMDPDNNNVITFKLDDFKSRLSHQLAFQLFTNVIGKKVHSIGLVEGASTSVMSLYFWRAIGSPEINHSPTPLK